MSQLNKRSQNLMNQLQQEATKLDKDLTAKEAKLQNLQQAISLAEQKQQSLDVKLKNYEAEKKKAIDDSLVEIQSKTDVATEEFTLLELANNKKRKSASELDTVITEKQTVVQALESEIAGLTSKKESITKTIDDLKIEQHSLTDTVTDLKGEIVELNTKKDSIHADIKTIANKAAVARQGLDNLESDYNTLKSKKQDELNAILQKTSDCLTRLQKFEAQEREKRAALAKDLMAMEKERESLLFLKAQSNQLDKQIENKKRLMKL